MVKLAFDSPGFDADGQSVLIVKFRERFSDNVTIMRLWDCLEFDLPNNGLALNKLSG